LLSLAIALPATALPDAAGARSTKRTICRAETALRYSPGGVEIGRLQRGDRVIVVDYARRKRWAYVLSGRGSGWVVVRAFCS
jgi:hypothetical protein